MKSLIAPKNILRGKKASPKAFYNFMVGSGRGDSTSSISSASNNIVRFSSGSVKPNTSGISSLLGNISSYVSNNYTDSIKNNTTTSTSTSKVSPNIIKNETNNITNNVIKNVNKNFSNVVSNLTNQVKEVVKKTQAQIESTNKNFSSIVAKINDQVKSTVDKTQKQVEASNKNFSGIIVNITNQFKNEKEKSQKQIESLNKNFSGSVTKLTTEIKGEKERIQKQVEALSKNFSGVAEKVNTQFKDVVSKTKNQIDSLSKNFSGSISKVTDQVKDEKGKSQKEVGITLKNLIQNFKKDYQQQVQEKDASKPSSLLKNFLGLYKNAIDLINYFGDSRNHKRISNSLKNLRKIFAESFEVATIVRQSISKIVKQLSNLPTASGTAPDLNIDVKVPGSSLKQMGTKTVNQLTKGQGMSAGVGMLGLGLLGAGAAAYGMNKAREFQERELYSKAKGVEKSPEVPSDFVDGLKNIISRLVESIDKLVSMGQKPASRSSSSSSTTQTTQGDQQGMSGASAINMSDFSAEDVDVMGKMIAAEAGVDGKPEDQATVMNAMLNRYRSIKSGVARPEDYGITGKTKENITLKDILSVQSQWQPLRNGRFASMTSEIGQRAMQNALSVGGNDPNKIYQLAISRGLSPEHAENLAKATFFYNPQISGNTPQPGALQTILPGGNQHAFQQPNNPRLRLGTMGSAYQASVGEQPLNNQGIAQAQAQPSAPILPPPPSLQQARPAQAQVGPQIINLPPEVISAPIQPQVNVQNKVVPPITTGSEGSVPDVTGLMDTANPENPYIFLPFSLGIMM